MILLVQHYEKYIVLVILRKGVLGIYVNHGLNVVAPTVYILSGNIAAVNYLNVAVCRMFVTCMYMHVLDQALGHGPPPYARPKLYYTSPQLMCQHNQSYAWINEKFDPGKT